MEHPLADRIRPQSLDEVVGQKHLLGGNALLRRFIEKGTDANMVFYGPSGTGKTTIANIIARRTQGDGVGAGVLAEYEDGDLLRALFSGPADHAAHHLGGVALPPEVPVDAVGDVVHDCSDWQVEGSWTEWDYAITSPSQGLVAAIGKELFNWTDTYVIDVEDQSNALGEQHRAGLIVDVIAVEPGEKPLFEKHSHRMILVSPAPGGTGQGFQHSVSHFSPDCNHPRAAKNAPAGFVKKNGLTALSGELRCVLYGPRRHNDV